jgi:signal transduction histidine kinase
MLHSVPTAIGATKTPFLVVWMVLAIVGVAGLAYIDLQRESRAALDELADDQAWLASALSRALVERVAPVEGQAEATAPVPIDRVLSSVQSFERPGDVRVIVQPPNRTELLGSDGVVVDAPAIAAGFAGHRRSVTLSRPEASALGLPHRIAMAGLARVEAGASGPWGLAVVATAQSERDREARARARILLEFLLVTALVLAFGGVALRRRTRELELRHALTIGAIEKQRDERLVRADKLATLGALAMGIAHEVSTPLGVIVARADQLRARDGVDDRVRRCGDVIVAETDRINAVIRGLLALARGGSPSLEEARPASLARDAMNAVSHRFAKASVRLSGELDPKLPVVACDPKLLEQVLVNLLLNACDACNAGGEVELAIHADAGRIRFVITDDGAGIRDEDAARATEPFFTTKPEGTGLGLAIANEIVKHHRGSLVLRPRGGQRGTEAVVELPVSPASEGNATR